MTVHFESNLGAMEKYCNKILGTVLSWFYDTRPLQFKLGFSEIFVCSKKNPTVSSHIELTDTSYKIYLFADMKERLFKSLFEFAHEIGHLLLYPIAAQNIYSNYTRSDSSFAITTLTRKSGNQIYGTVFEEGFCNWFAERVLKETFGEEVCEDILSESQKEEIQLVQSIIDSSSIVEDKLNTWDQVIRISSGSLEPINAFLFGISVADMSRLIHHYDKFIGDGSWKNLMKKFYKFCKANTDERHDIKLDILTELQQFQVKNLFNVRQCMMAENQVAV